MGLGRRLRTLDDSFEAMFDRAAPSDRSKERLGLLSGLLVVATVGVAKVLGGATPLWAVVGIGGLFALLVWWQVRALHRRRDRR